MSQYWINEKIKGLEEKTLILENRMSRIEEKVNLLLQKPNWSKAFASTNPPWIEYPGRTPMDDEEELLEHQ